MKDLFNRSDTPLRGVLRVDSTLTRPWENAHPQVDISLSDIRKGELSPPEAMSRALEHLSSYEGCCFTFTDGSKTTEGAGCAFISGRDTRSFRCQSIVQCLLFTSELIAISKALCFIEVSDEASHLILSDSLSGLLALKAFNPTNPIVQDILARLKGSVSTAFAV